MALRIAKRFINRNAPAAIAESIEATAFLQSDPDTRERVKAFVAAALSRARKASSRSREDVVVVAGDHVAGGLDVDHLGVRDELEHVGQPVVGDHVRARAAHDHGRDRQGQRCGAAGG